MNCVHRQADRVGKACIKLKGDFKSIKTSGTEEK